MKAYFRKLFSIELRHNYYADNIGTDLDIAVATDTLGRLRNHRLLTRQQPGKLLVYYEAKDAAGTPCIPINRYIPFIFHLRIRNAAFAQHTQLPFYGQQIFYFSNYDLAGNARLPTMGSEEVLLQDAADYQLVIPEASTFSVAGSGLNSVKIAAFFPGSGFTEPESIDIHAGVARGSYPQSGLFQISSSTPVSKTLRFTEGGLKQDIPFAIVQIWKGADTDYQTPRHYVIQWEKP